MKSWSAGVPKDGSDLRTSLCIFIGIIKKLIQSYCLWEQVSLLAYRTLLIILDIILVDHTCFRKIVQDIKRERWVLTEEGKTYAAAGSPEMQVFCAIPPPGISVEELQVIILNIWILSS